MDTISGFSGKSYEKIVQKIDPGNRENGVHGARVCPGIFQINSFSPRLTLEFYGCMKRGLPDIRIKFTSVPRVKISRS
jgi:hypothetical protein